MPELVVPGLQLPARSGAGRDGTAAGRRARPFTLTWVRVADERGSGAGPAEPPPREGSVGCGSAGSSLLRRKGLPGWAELGVKLVAKAGVGNSSEAGGVEEKGVRRGKGSGQPCHGRGVQNHDRGEIRAGRE